MDHVPQDIRIAVMLAAAVLFFSATVMNMISVDQPNGSATDFESHASEKQQVPVPHVEQPVTVETKDQIPLGISRTIRAHPPSHYLFKIESFSSLIEMKLNMYKSEAFEAGGHQWRLVLYPNGHRNSNGCGFISLFLEIDKTQNLSLDWEVNVDFKLFVFDQIRDRYMVVKDMNVPIRRYYQMKTRWGIPQLLSVEAFINPVNGYLFDDSCIFGAEVFVIQRPAKWEQLSVIGNPRTGTVTWKADNVSKLDDGDYDSPVESIDNIDWQLKAYHPKGKGTTKGTKLKICLQPFMIHPMRKILVEYKLRVKDQINSIYIETPADKSWFLSRFKDSGCGPCACYVVKLDELHKSFQGCIVNDSLIVEAEIRVVAKVERFPTICIR